MVFPQSVPCAVAVAAVDQSVPWLQLEQTWANLLFAPSPAFEVLAGTGGGIFKYTRGVLKVHINKSTCLTYL